MPSTLKCLYFVRGDVKMKYKFDQEVPWDSTETIIREKFNLPLDEKLHFLDTAYSSIISHTLLARLPPNSVIYVETVLPHNSSINKIQPVEHNEKELKEFNINDRSFGDKSINQLKMSDLSITDSSSESDSSSSLRYKSSISSWGGTRLKVVNKKREKQATKHKFARRKLDLQALNINSNNVLTMMTDIHEKYLAYAQAHQLKDKMMLSS
ncbi:hypothetical protein I4U23_017266 [Adineta vaga]|nr:hypothetical protein I4U23_017266 [Adineta vaga]